MPEARLAFVDLETTGLSPGADRVIEIGVVTVDGARVSEWSTLINPGVRVGGQSRFASLIDSDVIADAPRFKDIAPELFSRLEGRLLIAHNARFDHAFLKADFDEDVFALLAKRLSRLSHKQIIQLPGHERTL
jgi:DNA polymerase-3 subunit epsilon